MLIFDVWEGITFLGNLSCAHFVSFQNFFFENNLSQKETKEQIRYIIQRHRKTLLISNYVSSAQIKYEGQVPNLFAYDCEQNFYQPGISSIHTLFNIFTTLVF